MIVIKLTSPDDRVFGFFAATGERDLPTVETSRGTEQTISTAKYQVTGRGGKGRELLQRRSTRAMADDSRCHSSVSCARRRRPAGVRL